MTLIIDIHSIDGGLAIDDSSAPAAVHRVVHGLGAEGPLDGQGAL